MTMRKLFITSVLLMLSLSLSGCMGKSVNKTFATAYGTGIVAGNITRDLVNQNLLAVDKAQVLHDKLAQAGVALNGAWMLKQVNADEAKSQAGKVTESLDEILKTLELMEVK